MLPIGCIRRIRFSLVLVVGALLSAACMTTRPGAAPAATPDPAMGFEAQWEQLKQAARSEGDLVISGGNPDRYLGPFYKHFEDKFGVRVTAVATTNFERLAAEQSRGIYSEDIAMPGSTTVLQFAQAEMNEPFLEWLIHPDVLENRQQTHIIPQWMWIDPPNKYAPVTTARIRDNLTLIFYNTSKVSQAEIDSVTSWKDFVKPQWKGRLGLIAHPDGSSGDTRGLFYRVLGPEWLQAMVIDQSPTLLRPETAAREAAEMLARGEFDVLTLSPAEVRTPIAELEKIGLPVKELTRVLAEGPEVTARARFTIMKQPPHPNATKLFINWVLSREGAEAFQTMTLERDYYPFIRKDIPQGQTSDEDWVRLQSLNAETLASPGNPISVKSRQDVYDFLTALYKRHGRYGY